MPRHLDEEGQQLLLFCLVVRPDRLDREIHASHEEGQQQSVGVSIRVQGVLEIKDTHRP